MEYPKASKPPSFGENVEPEAGMNGIVNKQKDKGHWRDVTAFWILSLCNGFGCMVMLSAAHDIIHRVTSEVSHHVVDQKNPDGIRLCNVMSTGTILLADTLPSLTIKILGPFLPFYINVRVFLVCFLQGCSFLLVAYADTPWMTLIGICLTSCSVGLGHLTFLSYSACFHRNVISAWASGNGAATIIGSLSYASLMALGVSLVNTMLIMLCVPVILAATFWILLRNPSTIPQKDQKIDLKNSACDQKVRAKYVKDTMTFSEKVRYIPSLSKYIIPLSLAFFSEYFINQGLFELVEFHGIWLDKRSQYRWLQVVFGIGVFISNSSVNLIKIKNLWLLCVLQMINVVLFLTEVLTFFSPSIWLVFGLVLWEGLIGGAAYVNTSYRISKEIPKEKQIFALATVPLALSCGISLAGIASMPVHNAICSLSLPTRSANLLDIFK